VQVRHVEYAPCSRRGDPLYDRRVRCDPTLRECELMLLRFARSLLHASAKSYGSVRASCVYGSYFFMQGSPNLWWTDQLRRFVICAEHQSPPMPCSARAADGNSERPLRHAQQEQAVCASALDVAEKSPVLQDSVHVAEHLSLRLFLRLHPSAPSPSSHRILGGASSLLRWRFYSWESL